MINTTTRQPKPGHSLAAATPAACASAHRNTGPTISKTTTATSNPTESLAHREPLPAYETFGRCCARVAVTQLT